MRVAIFPGICRARLMRKATMREVAMVDRMMGREVSPTSPIFRRFRPKPSRMTAYWSTFLEVKATPSFTLSLFFITAHSTMPNRMASTALPTISRAGASSTKNQASSATARHSSTPGALFCQIFISFSPRSLFLSPAAGRRPLRHFGPVRLCGTAYCTTPARPAQSPPGPAGHFLPLPRGTWPLIPGGCPAPPGCASSRRRIWAFMGPSSMWS